MYLTRITVITVALLSLLWMAPKVHAAYAARLVAPFASVPDGFGFREMAHQKGDTRLAALQSSVPANTHRGEIMVPILMQSAKVTSGKLLWAMYPGSVRGRVFSESGSVNDPIAFTPNSSAGGGW